MVRGKRGLIVDIGANCGAFTIPLSAAAGAGSKTLAFEPNPAMNDRLRVNLQLNGLDDRVTVHQVALGESSGGGTLSFSDNMGQATLHERDVPDGHTVRVSVRPLSGFMAEANLYEVVIIKIDVEGYEPEVLAPFFSATDPSRWPTHILIETEHRCTWSSDIMSILENLGYLKVGEHDGNTFLARPRV
jgi:FkbM family methyltransferase